MAHDEQLDMLMELTSHPGWRVLKRELQKEIDGLQAKALSPATEEFDLVKKEAVTYGIRTLNTFFARVEQVSKRYRESIRKGG